MRQTYSDWMPQSRQKVYEKVTELTVPYIDANLTRLGMESTTPLGKWYIQEFSPKGYNPYVTAYAAWVNPATRTPLAVVAMNEAEKMFTSYYRKLYNLMNGNVQVTDVDLEAMGFPKRRTGKRSPSPVATNAPEFGITPLAGFRLHIDYYPAGAAHKKGKPRGQHGVEIRWMFSEVPVSEPESLLNSVFDTASPATLTFSGNDQGRTLYLAMRWENTRGEKGPWSYIERALVP